MTAEFQKSTVICMKAMRSYLIGVNISLTDDISGIFVIRLFEKRSYHAEAMSVRPSVYPAVRVSGFISS